MALTRITKGVIKPNENYDTHNINSTGIVTAIGLDINGNGDISGNLSVGGVLTYEDVTSIDSVGIITAQSDIHVGAGVSVVGIVTAATFKGDGDFFDIDVDGHTNLDNVSVAGVSTFSDNVILAEQKELRLEPSGAFKLYRGAGGGGATNFIKSTFGSISVEAANAFIAKVNNNKDAIAAYANDRVDLYYNNQIKLTTASSGVNVSGTTTTTGLAVTGVSTFTGNIDANGDLDVDGHTNLDNVSIAGVTTGTTINATTFVGNLTGDVTGDVTGAATRVTLTNQSGDSTCNVLFAQSATGNQLPHTNANLTFNATNGRLTAGSFVGNLTGDVTGAATQLTVTDESSDTNTFLVFTNGATGNQIPHTGTNLTFNSNTGTLTATSFAGDGSNLTGIISDKIFEGNTEVETVDTGSNGHIKLTTEGTERLRIDKDGILWVNYGNPQSSSLMILDKDGTGDAELRFYNAGSNKAKIALDSDEHLTFDVNGDNRLHIASNGNITVNKGNTIANATIILSKGATGYAKLEFDEVNTQRAYIELDASESLVHYGAAGVEQHFYAGGGKRITIGTGGDIAIGNHTPDGQLSIRAANASFPRLVISNTDYDENINLSTYHDANGIYAFLGANSKLDSSGNITRDTSGHRSSGIILDARTYGILQFYTGDASGNPTEKLRITSGGSVNIGGDYTQTTYKMKVTGSFAATTKSFVIDHPTKENHSLRYACLEGPENSVYVRGKTSDSVIELPDYWTGLVHEDSITVNVTSIGDHKVWVESINNNSVTIGSDGSEYFYTVFAERKDVDKLEVEVAK